AQREMQSETEDTVYYISDAETSPGDSFEFSEAECDMHLRLAMEEKTGLTFDPFLTGLFLRGVSAELKFPSAQLMIWNFFNKSPHYFF
ncbi:hypothetical protein CEXT_348011, partial [Caerostris extrusa]